MNWLRNAPGIATSYDPRSDCASHLGTSYRQVQRRFSKESQGSAGPGCAGFPWTLNGRCGRHGMRGATKAFQSCRLCECTLEWVISFALSIFRLHLPHFFRVFYVRIAIYISSSIILQFSFHYTPILINITLSQIFLSGAYLQHHQQKYSYLMYQLSVQVSLNTKSFALSLTTPTANFSFYAKMVFCWRLQTTACHHDFSFFLFIPFTPFSYSQVWRTPSGPYLRLWMKWYIFL